MRIGKSNFISMNKLSQLCYSVIPTHTLQSWEWKISKVPRFDTTIQPFISGRLLLQLQHFLHQPSPPRLTIYQRFVPSPESMLLTQSLLLSQSLFRSLSTIQSTVKCCLLVKCISASFQSKIFFFCQVYIHLVDHILMPSSSTQFRHDKLFTKAWGWIYTFYNFYTAKC